MPIRATAVSTLLQVYDMQKSVAWYRDVLGFKVLQAYEPHGHLYWALLKLGGAQLMLNAKYEDEERPAQPPPTVGHDDVTLYVDCTDVDEAYAVLRTSDLQLEPPQMTHYGMKQLTVVDPDGFQVCFQQPA
jgi:uncharacterized glyoxalase superfamily protein PhnB